MNKLFLTFFLILLSYNSFGQRKTSYSQIELDSLWSVWQDETQADTTRLTSLGIYSWYGHVFSQPDSAFYYADLQLEFAKRIKSKKHIGYAISTKGTALWVKGEYPKSLDFFHQHLEIEKELRRKGGVASALNKLGIVYGSLGDHIKQIEYYQKSLKIREELGDQHNIAIVLANIGVLYHELDNNAKALEYYQRALKIREKLGDQVWIAVSLAQVGEIYQVYGDYDTALEYHTKSLKLAEEFGSKIDIVESLKNMGDIFKFRSDYVKALDYYQRSIELSISMGAKPEISILLGNIGDLLIIQKKYSKSVEKCKEAYQIALSIGDVLKQKTACECLYKGYKGLKNNNQALDYFEKASALNDSLKSEETAKKLQQMEFAKTILKDSIAKVENDRLVEASHQEELRKKNQTRNIAVGIGAFILFLSLLLYNRLKFVRKSKATLQVEKDRSENLLLNILPEEIAQELKEYGKAKARDFDRVSILFTDFKSFTQNSAKLGAQELVAEINTCFETFDGIIEKHNIEKIKTIGDAYMAAGGLPIYSEDSIKNTVLAGLEMQSFITARFANKKDENEIRFEMRLGIHTGPVVAGIVGVKKFQYDIWGNTVNIASRMESNSEVGKVNISQDTFDIIKDDSQFAFESRGEIDVKGKGEMEMYFVTKSLKNSM